MVTNLDAVAVDDTPNTVTVALTQPNNVTITEVVSGLATIIQPNEVTVTLASALSTGSSLLYGTGAPSSLAGVQGDFYVDTTTVALFGPKGASVWPSAPLGKFVPAPAATYTVSNAAPDRSYDAATVAVAELANVVGTLIADLRAAGIVL